MNTNNIIIIVLVFVLFVMLFSNHITIITPVPNKPIGGCAGTRYGCCPNGTTSRINPLGTNCYK